MEKKGTKSPSVLVQMFDSGLKKAARNAAWNWKRDNRKRLFYEIMASPTLIDQMAQPAISLDDRHEIQVMDHTFMLDNQEAYQRLLLLGERDMLIVLLYYLKDYSAREIAKLLNVTAKTIHNRLALARKRMRG